MDRSKLPTNRWRCEHASYPVEVVPVAGGKKKIAHCLGCGANGPARTDSREAVRALRGDA